MKKISYKNIGTYGLFLLLSIIFTIFLCRTGKIGIASDGSFHFSRVEEIFQNLKSGQLFTFIATHTFHSSGVGSFLFYPTVFLYPWALLRFIFNPVTSFYMWYGMFMFLTLSIAYYSMRNFSNSRSRAIIFALFYTISIYHIYLGVKNYVLGEFIAYTFVPLAMYGFYEIMWGNIKKWPILSIGVTLLFYSHIVSTVLAVALMFILFIFNLIINPYFSRERWMGLFKSVMLTIPLVFWIIYPFFTDFIHTKLGTPHFGFMLLYSMEDFLNASLKNYATNRGIGIVLLTAALVGWYFVRNSKKDFVIYILGIIFIVLSTNLFPYNILGKISILSFLGGIQFPYRFSTYSSLFMSAVASLIFEQILKKLHGRTKAVALILIIMSGVCLYFQTLTPVLSRIYNVKSSEWLKEANSVLVPVPTNKVFNKDNYHNMYTYRVLYGETDYYPKESFDGNVPGSNRNAQSIILQQTRIGNKIIKVKSIPSKNAIQYKISLQKTADVDLPFIGYPSEEVYVNNKKVSHSISNRGTIKVKLFQGENDVVIQYKMNKLYYVLFVVMILTWLSIGGSYIVHRNKNRNNHMITRKVF